jgi:hypothetical protein
MTLQEKLDAFKAGKPPYNVPPEIHPIMERATRELIASGMAQRALKAGDKRPISHCPIRTAAPCRRPRFSPTVR